MSYLYYVAARGRINFEASAEEGQVILFLMSAKIKNVNPSLPNRR